VSAGSYQNRTVSAGSPDINWVIIRAFLIVVWRQGIKRKTRLRFWANLAIMLWRYPAVAANYVSVCAQAEHFLEFRQIVRDNIEAQLQAYLDAKQAKEEKTNDLTVSAA